MGDLISRFFWISSTHRKGAKDAEKEYFSIAAETPAMEKILVII